MADTKISDLPAASSVSGTDILPIVQSATTKQATLTQVVGLAGGTTSKVSGSDFTTTTVGSYVDITGLSFSAAANKLYEIDVLLRFQNSNTQAQHFQIAFSASGASGQQYYIVPQAVTTAVTNTNEVNNAQSASLGLVATTNLTAWIKGIVVTGANTGNITVKTERDGAGTTTVYIGSRMTVTLLA